jgi:hypothetical protein
MQLLELAHDTLFIASDVVPATLAVLTTAHFEPFHSSPRVESPRPPTAQQSFVLAQEIERRLPSAEALWA